MMRTLALLTAMRTFYEQSRENRPRMTSSSASSSFWSKSRLNRMLLSLAAQSFRPLPTILPPARTSRNRPGTQSTPLSAALLSPTSGSPASGRPSTSKPRPTTSATSPPSQPETALD